MAPKNYKPLPIDLERFPNISGVGVDQEFVKQGEGFETWHFQIQGTRIYVQGLVEGKNTEQVVDLLNQPDVGDDNPLTIVYEYKSF